MRGFEAGSNVAEGKGPSCSDVPSRTSTSTIGISPVLRLSESVCGARGWSMTLTKVDRQESTGRIRDPDPIMDIVSPKRQGVVK